MTLRARAFGLFPAAWLATVGTCACFALIEPGVASVVALLAALYLVPVTCFRAHNALWPLVEGRSRLDTPEYSPWWGGHQFEIVYSAFPALEAALRLVPGAYSAWLRLWGSRIGRRVHWTPRLDITDRSLLEVGDDVVFGHLVACYAHVAEGIRSADRLSRAAAHLQHADGAEAAWWLGLMTRERDHGGRAVRALRIFVEAVQ